MPPIPRPKPIVLTDIEIRAVLEAIGEGSAARLTSAGRPDLASALVRAKRALRASIQPAVGDSGAGRR